MIKNKLKTLSAIALTVASFSSFADATYSGNQGIKTSNFDANYFSGQWETESAKRTPLKILKRSPKFVVMYTAKRDFVQERLEQLESVTTRTEYLHAMKIQDYTRKSLYYVNQVLYFNENFTQADILDEDIEYKASQVANEEYYDFRDVYDKNIIAIEAYTKNNAIDGVDILTYYDYRNLDVIPSKNFDRINKAKKNHLKKYNFDFEKEIDFFMLDSKAQLMGIDIISKDKFALYKLSDRKPSALIFSRPEKEHEVKTYDQFFKEFEEEHKKKQQEDQE